ncbi:hypothetical protein [Herbaspirillum rubrisubalbicans]|uniref:Ribbon-helix-helix protein, CopG family n=1 Tax=Herbaspirillum rubrisubalbicans TaxID=80842 RepID=A0ABX9C5C4_9BURK|nr:hypothetical protein [Herbaspirillum rubrisubalbicans]RAM65715.1 hypothetical protein RB24_05800 [Herbaspirillum rubrisubalbicans]
MALKPKDAVLQVRVDRELLIQFQLMCEAREFTASAFLRRVMLAEVARFREQQEAAQRKRDILNRQQGA